MSKEIYIGLMSGTSLDGVDVVLCEIDENSCNLIDALEYPITKELKDDILTMIESKNSLELFGEIDCRLGLLFTNSVNALLKKSNIDSSNIKAIGSHGQTLWHKPDGKYPFSMQLGDPNIITVNTGITVISDFRRKDIALGGQGAPFAPAFHEFLFSNISEHIAIVNIGGMSNITVLNEKLIGYDMGCGNVLIDMHIYEHKNLAYDKDGEWAKSGKINFELLDTMLLDNYFSLPYPKSTGREYFNAQWLTDKLNLIKSKNLKIEDIQRTLLELTAISISNEVLKFNRDLLLLCGGGAKNTFLLERLKILMPNIEVAIAINADYIEAMTFAWLAYKRIHKESVNLKDVTGASKNTILGGIYE